MSPVTVSGILGGAEKVSPVTVSGISEEEDRGITCCDVCNFG